MTNAAILQIPPLASEAIKALPDAWGAEIKSQLPAESLVLDWVEADLDADLHFSQGIIALTKDRVIAKAPGDTHWQQ